jgi:hypothetical protein
LTVVVENLNETVSFPVYVVSFGVFELVYASGQNWYGEELKFGPKTQYTKSDSILTFQKSNRKINGHSISLQSVVGGNMTSQTMNSDQF